MILGPDQAPSGGVDVDVCVIGSGAGGAAATWKLAEAGLDVVCLEAGGHFTEKDFSQDFGRAACQLYDESAQRVMMGNVYIPLASGRCVGGSTVVNSGICFRIPEWRFDQWKDDHGLDFSFGDLLPFLEATEGRIGVSPSNPAVFGKNNAFCQKGLEELGWSGGPMPRNAPACVGCGACQTGCPTGSKLSVARTFIPDAVGLGATLFTRARADEVLVDGTRVVGVRASLLSDDGHRVERSLEVRARAVVVAAGSVRSPALLQRNGLGNQHVGRHLHVHPATGSIGLTDELIQGWRGIPQGFYSDEFIEDGIILESFWASPEAYYLSFPFGLDGTESMLDLEKMVALGAITADSSEGTVKALDEPGRLRVSYQLNRTDKARLVRAQQKICELLLAAGARDIATGIHGVPRISSMDQVRKWLDPEGLRPKQLVLYASHPHGSVRMGEDPEKSCVDSAGELRGSKGLYVMDGSIFPGVLGVNPQVTIMAMAQMLAGRLADSLR